MARDYIVLLMPRERDAQILECFRRQMCCGCDERRTFGWPVHMSLFYGIRVSRPQALLAGLGQIASSTPVFNLYISRLASFERRIIYLRIRRCREMMQLQRKVRELAQAIGADLPGLPKRYDAEPPSAVELKNIRQWGSYHSFVPHITLANNLEPDEHRRACEVGQELFSGLDRHVLADEITCSLFSEHSGFPEKLESFKLAPAR